MFDINPYLDEFENAPVSARMRSTGHYLFRRKLDSGTALSMRRAIDQLAENDSTEINYAGSEHRIWHAADKNAIFEPVRTMSNHFMSVLYGRPANAHNVLAIRNRPTPDGAERTNVRWHLDSFRRQLKLFLFLTDVGENNGPLELVPRTHTPLFKMLNALPLKYYAISDFRNMSGNRRSWQRIHDNTVKMLAQRGYEPKPMKVAEGSFLLVDTSAVHRARPCQSGERYAVTIYHR